MAQYPSHVADDWHHWTASWCEFAHDGSLTQRLHAPRVVSAAAAKR